MDITGPTGHRKCSNQQQKQLYEEKGKKKKDNMTIKLDPSKGCVITSNKAEAYEIQCCEEAAQEEAQV